MLHLEGRKGSKKMKLEVNKTEDRIPNHIVEEEAIRNEEAPSCNLHSKSEEDS